MTDKTNWYVKHEKQDIARYAELLEQRLAETLACLKQIADTAVDTLAELNGEK